MEYSTWSRRIADLGRSLSGLEAEAEALGVPSQAPRAWHANLRQKLLPQVTDVPYLIVAVAGGTNIGKSTVFNHLAGFPASRVHPDATQTKHPVCLLPRAFSHAHDLSRVFPGFELVPWQSEDDAIADGPANRLIYREDPSGAQPPNLVLLDTPDIDGALPVNWDRARLIGHAADVLVAILTQQKFNDAAVRRFFRESAEADKTVLVVFNMIEWPEDREHCLRWLETFRKGTGAEPAHVYAVPRDRAAARENRLSFHPLSAAATDPRPDLAELKFTEIKLRSLRGALRQMLDRADGLPAYLDDLRARAEENRRVREVIHQKVQIKIQAPELPGRVVGDEIWRWLEPRRTRFDRAVHQAYGALGDLIFRVVPGRRDPADEVAGYERAEHDSLTRALEDIYAELEGVSKVGDPAVRRELEPVLAGAQRQEAFRELDRRLGETPLLSEAYRRAVARELGEFQDKHPRMMRAIEWGLVATAVIRPAITIGMFGAADLAGHVILQGGAHSVGQVFFDAVAGAAMTGSGEVAFKRLGPAVRQLMTRLFTEFYRERAQLLAGIIHECVIGSHLGRIDRLAGLDERDDYKAARKTAASLTNDLALLEMQSAPTPTAAQAPAQGGAVPAARAAT